MSDAAVGTGCLPCKPEDAKPQDAQVTRVQYNASPNKPADASIASAQAASDEVEATTTDPKKAAAEEAAAPEEAKAEEAKSEEESIEERAEKLAADESVDVSKLWSKFLDVKSSVDGETVSDVLVTFKAIMKRIEAPADKIPLFSIPEKMEDVSFKDGKYIHNPQQSKLLQRWKTYDGELPLKGVKVVIVGAGPAGLRLAVELAFNGAKCHVLESREYLERRNTLYVWKFSQLDLISLGMKTLWPQFAMGELRLINIGLLQHALMRAALVLGVTVWPKTKYVGLDEDGSILTSGPKFSDAAILVDSTGNRGIVKNTIWKGKELITSKLRNQVSKEAIALTFNSPRNKKKDNRAAQIMVTASVDRQVLLSKKIKLENLVYFRSPLSNYVVCTLLKRKALKDFGIVKKNFKDAYKLLARENVDNEALKKLSIAIATEWKIPLGPKDKELCITRRGDHDCMLFRFDNLKQAEEPMRRLDTKNGKLIVTVVGDAAASPFWPRGTGANHSILFSLCIAGALRTYYTSEGDEDTRYKAMEKGLKENFDGVFNDAKPNKVDFGMGIRHPEGHY